jgi:hypothetical protein
MSTWIIVARNHLIDRANLVVQPWVVLALAFMVNVVIFANAPHAAGGGAYTGGVASIYLVLLVVGALTIRQLPFVLALGVSRRSFFLGTVLLAAAAAAVYGLGLTVLQVIEQATGGWWLSLHFFRVPYLLSGPGYLTWLTSFLGLALMLAWGIWLGIVYRRWGVTGLLALAAAQVLALIAAVLMISWVHGWLSVGRFFTTLTIGGLDGLVAALTVVLLAGGYATIRRVTV